MREDTLLISPEIITFSMLNPGLGRRTSSSLGHNNFLSLNIIIKSALFTVLPPQGPFFNLSLGADFMSALWTRNRIFGTSLLWVILNTIMHGPPYCILPTPFRLYRQGFKHPPVGLMTQLRLEWIRQLTEKDVLNLISRSRSYPVILFIYAILYHLFRSCCVCFRWPNLRKSF